MKTIVRKSTISTTGYELVVIDEMGNENVHAIDKMVPAKSGTTMSLVLPDNPSNRKYWTIAKVEADGGESELTYKESKTFGPRAPQKPLEEYMTEEELELKYQYERMLEEVEQRRRGELELLKEQKKNMSKEEKLREQLKKLQAKLDELTAE